MEIYSYEIWDKNPFYLNSLFFPDMIMVLYIEDVIYNLYDYLYNDVYNIPFPVYSFYQKNGPANLVIKSKGYLYAFYNGQYLYLKLLIHYFLQNTNKEAYLYILYSLRNNIILK